MVAYVRKYKKKATKFSNQIPGSTYSRVRPGRLTTGKSAYTKSRKVAKRIQPLSELKLQALKALNCFTPSPIVTPPGSNSTGVYETNFVFGDAITEWDRFAALQGFQWPTGVNPGQRVGKYMYLRNTMLKLQIQMNASQGPVVSPTRFRCIVFKARKSNIPTGVVKDPSQSIFLNTVGNEFGSKNLGLDGMDFTTSITNKRNYIIVKDCQFILQPSVVTPQGSATMPLATNYKSMHNIAMSLGHFKKCSFNPATEEPDDINYQYGITIFGIPVNDCGTQMRDWSVSLRGTTSAYDN